MDKENVYENFVINNGIKYIFTFYDKDGNKIPINTEVAEPQQDEKEKGELWRA